MRRGLVMAAALAGLSLGAGEALAHAQLQSAAPKVGGRASSPIAVFILRFSEPIEPAFSRIVLTDAAGRAIPVEIAVEPGDHRVVRARPPSPLDAGRYHVRWRVLSVDGHRTQGEYDFSVAA